MGGSKEGQEGQGEEAAHAACLGFGFWGLSRSWAACLWVWLWGVGKGGGWACGWVMTAGTYDLNARLLTSCPPTKATRRLCPRPLLAHALSRHPTPHGRVHVEDILQLVAGADAMGKLECVQAEVKKTVSAYGTTALYWGEKTVTRPSGSCWGCVARTPGARRQCTIRPPKKGRPDTPVSSPSRSSRPWNGCPPPHPLPHPLSPCPLRPA